MKPIAKAIKSVAYEMDYYDIKDPNANVPKDSVDKLNQKTETYASPIISRFLNDRRINITIEERDIFAWIIATFSQRTHFAREALVNVFSALGDRDFTKFVNDEEAFFNLAEEAGLDRNSDDVRKARELFLEGKLKREYERGGVTEDYFMKTQLELVEPIANIFLNKHWSLLESDNTEVFLTSDHPVVLLPSPHHRPGMQVGYIDGRVLLPLSPNIALLLSNEFLSNDIIKVNSDKMLEYQWYTITRSYKQVFSNILSDHFQTVLERFPQGEVIKAYVK